MNNISAEEYGVCWICHEKFEEGDEVVDFMGFAHFICFDNRMKENEERNNTNE